MTNNNFTFIAYPDRLFRVMLEGVLSGEKCYFHI